MSRLFNVAKIAEMALQRIGAYAVNDTQADAAEMERTIEWMEIAVSEFSGTEHAALFEYQTLSATLTPGTASYVLADLYAPNWPTEDMAFAIRAQIRTAAGNANDYDIDLIDRQKYLDIGNKEQTGLASQAWIERTTTPKIYLDHVPPVDSAYVLMLTFQTYARDLMGGSSEGQGNIAHGFRAEWQNWLTLNTACEIGAGPVRRLPLQELRDMRQERDASYERLMARAAAFTVSQQLQRTEPWGM